MGLIVSAGTLCLGIIIGYMGQRSGFCTIGGIRNFILAGDMHLLKGLAAFAAAAFAGFLFAGGVQQDFPGAGEFGTNACTNPYGNAGHNDVRSIVILTITGGLGIGFFSMMANGCPFRQHVRAGEGDAGAVLYILGFYFAVIAFGFLIKPIIGWV